MTEDYARAGQSPGDVSNPPSGIGGSNKRASPALAPASGNGELTASAGPAAIASPAKSEPAARTVLLLIVALMATFAYVSLVGLVYLSQRALLYPGTSATLPPEHASWGENVSIRTPDGETLHGLYDQGESGKPSVLFFLGNADRVSNYGFLAQALAARGIGLLAISYRGYPGSTGSPTEEGLLTDGIAAFGFRYAPKARLLCWASHWAAASR